MNVYKVVDKCVRALFYSPLWHSPWRHNELWARGGSISKSTRCMRSDYFLSRWPRLQRPYQSAELVSNSFIFIYYTYNEHKGSVLIKTINSKLSALQSELSIYACVKWNSEFLIWVLIIKTVKRKGKLTIKLIRKF